MSTKMAFVEDALTSQETRYLAALGSAQRYAIAGDTLRIYVAGGGQLRLIRAAPGSMTAPSSATGWASPSAPTPAVPG